MYGNLSFLYTYIESKERVYPNPTPSLTLPVVGRRLKVEKNNERYSIWWNYVVICYLVCEYLVSEYLVNE